MNSTIGQAEDMERNIGEPDKDKAGFRQRRQDDTDKKTRVGKQAKKE